MQNHQKIIATPADERAQDGTVEGAGALPPVKVASPEDVIALKSNAEKVVLDGSNPTDSVEQALTFVFAATILRLVATVENRDAELAVKNDTIIRLTKTVGLQAGVIAGFQSQPQPSRWVPVAESLPPEYECVLVYREGVPAFVGPIIAFWTGEKWCEDVMKDSYYVTHWQKLPDTPAPTPDGA